MGAGNVKAVFVHWSQLAGGPFRLLTYMALRTKDGDTRPRFWGGREDLAFGLGRRVPADDGTEESRRAREAAFKATKAAVAVLTRAGAVTLVERARPGHNAVYALNLNPVRGTETVPHSPVDNSPSDPVDNPDRGTETVHHMGHGFRTEWGTVSVPNGARFSSGMGYGNRPPKEEKDESGLSEGGETQGFPASSPLCTTPPANDEDQHTTGTTNTTAPRFDYRAACEYLLTIPGAVQTAAVGKATDELGDTARREDILTRAAHIAYAAQTGVPA